MANLSDITVKDATSPTPVDHVFKPMVAGPNQLVFNTVTQATLQGRERVVIEQSDRKDSRSVSVKTYLPVSEAVTGPNGSDTIVKRQSFAGSNLVVPVQSTLQERKDLIELHCNLLKHAFLRAIVENGEWAT